MRHNDREERTGLREALEAAVDRREQHALRPILL